MNLTDVGFALFLPVVLGLHWLGPRRAGWQNAVLLAASLAFFATWHPGLLWVLVASTVADFLIGRALGRCRRDHPGDERRASALVALSLTVNLGGLLWFKYQGFLGQSLDMLLRGLGLPGTTPALSLVAPIGISYWTLSRISYVLEVRAGRLQAASDPLAFATWIAFFPQLLAGPISRGAEMLPQYQAARRPEPSQWASGAATFLVGLAMKAWVAEYLAQQIVGPVFADSAAFDTVSHWMALGGFAVQVFADFAGYSLMAIGVGRLLGLELPRNFDYPFLSRGMFAFWRRWHISLNTWLFDYVFAPLTTRGPLRGRFVGAFVITFIVSGLWHGAAWTFVVWGLVHGVALAAEYLWDERFRGLARHDRRWVTWQKSLPWGAASVLATQLFFVLSLVPFRAPTLSASTGYLRALVGAGGAQRLDMSGADALLVLVGVVAYHLPALRPGGAVIQRFVGLPAPVRGLAYGLVIVFLALFAPVGTGTFIYARF